MPGLSDLQAHNVLRRVLSCHAENPAVFEEMQDMKFVVYNIQWASLLSKSTKNVMCHP